jgi:hypothetical protein
MRRGRLSKGLGDFETSVRNLGLCCFVLDIFMVFHSTGAVVYTFIVAVVLQKTPIGKDSAGTLLCGVFYDLSHL